jgi:hypothetical protein
MKIGEIERIGDREIPGYKPPSPQQPIPQPQPQKAPVVKPTPVKAPEREKEKV